MKRRRLPLVRVVAGFALLWTATQLMRASDRLINGGSPSCPQAVSRAYLRWRSAVIAGAVIGATLRACGW